MPKLRKRELQATSLQHNQAMYQSTEAGTASSRQNRLRSKMAKFLPTRSKITNAEPLPAPEKKGISTIKRFKNKISSLVKARTSRQKPDVAPRPITNEYSTGPEYAVGLARNTDNELIIEDQYTRPSNALVRYRPRPRHVVESSALPKMRIVPQVDQALGQCISRLLARIAYHHSVRACSPQCSAPVTLAKLASSDGAEFASGQIPISERASAPERIGSPPPRPLSDSFNTHTRNLSEASTVGDHQQSVTQTPFPPTYVLPTVAGRYSHPLDAICKQLQVRCASLMTELERYKRASVVQKRVIAVVPGLENEVQKLEGLVNLGVYHALEDRAAPRRTVDRLALVREKFIIQALAAQVLTTQLTNHNHFLSETVLGLNEQLQDQVAAFNLQVQITNHLSGLYDQLRQAATLQLNQQSEATNNIAAQYEHLRQTATVQLQEANHAYDELVAEHGQRIEQWTLLQERAEVEKEETRGRLREAREEVDRVMPTIQLLQENVETFERNAEAALTREKAVKEENENLRNVLWAKTKQLEESERALKLSQDLHQKDADRADRLSRELHELQSQNETDIKVAAAKILETESQFKAEQDVSMALTQQNNLLRGVFRQKVDAESNTSVDNITAISSGKPNVDLLLNANQQQEGLVAWLERELSYASWARFSSKELEEQVAVSRQQKTLIEELKAKNKELDEKVFTEEISNVNTSERLQQSEAYIVRLANRLEEVNHELGQTQQVSNQLSNSNKQLLGQRLTREQLIRAEGWIVERLQAHLEVKEEEIATLTNQVAHHAEETDRIKEVAGMNIDLLRDEMYGARYTMGNTIIFAEANYRERNEAYAKLRAFEKRFAAELAFEPLIPESIYVAPFDEVAPGDFKERREAAWRWARGENDHLAGVESKAWYNLTPNDVHLMRAYHGLPPANLLEQAQMQLSRANEQAKGEMEESMARASEDLHGLIIDVDDSNADWVTESSPGPDMTFSASVATDHGFF